MQSPIVTPRMKHIDLADVPVLLSMLQPDEYLFETAHGVFSVRGVEKVLSRVRDNSMRTQTSYVFDSNNVKLEIFNSLSPIGFEMLQMAMITNQLFLQFTNTPQGACITFYLATRGVPGLN